MLAYFLKVNVAIVLFYAFYRLFFYKDTFFGWRRTALLCFFAVSAAVPLLNIQTWITEQEPMVAMADLYASVVLPELTIGASLHNCSIYCEKPGAQAVYPCRTCRQHLPVYPAYTRKRIQTYLYERFCAQLL